MPNLSNDGSSDSLDGPTVEARDAASDGRSEELGEQGERTGESRDGTCKPRDRTDEPRDRTDEPRNGTGNHREGGDDEWVIRGTDIEKTYDSWLPFTRTVEVLDGASVTIHESELVGIVGGNGSGKSTLMKILVGVLEKDAGTVERRGTVGWCPQETLLYDRLTVSETMRLFGSGYGMSTAEVRERLAWLADRLDYEEYLDTRIDHLSGGNRQKVNLSVALLHQPDVLLLDEPYTGFDWETYQAFWELTGELASQGTAIVVISHFVEEHDRFDRIYELRDGRLQRQASNEPASHTGGTG